MTNNNIIMIKVGTCGFTTKHFNYFDVLEVQQTFYDFVGEKSLKNWGSLAREKNVELTIKANQIITHPFNVATYKRMRHKIGNQENYGNFRLTKEVEEAWEITAEEARKLNAKVIVFQSPSSFKPTEENIQNLFNFFTSIRSNEFILAWEPRGEEWYSPKGKEVIKRLVEELGIIHVVDPFRHETLSEGIVYYRLHGIGKGEVNYRYKYTDQDLKTLASKVNKENNKITYVLFNNIYSFEDALRFKSLVK